MNKENKDVVVVQEKSIADNVLNRVKAFEETGMINVPKDYSAPNALRAAWLILLETQTLDKRPVLEVCTKESIANALLKMVIQGLNPVKHQCAFIAYGRTLNMQREYAGTIAIAKRDAGVKSVAANVVYEGDEFAWENNPETLEKKVTKHTQTLDSLEKANIKGAYSIVEYADGKRKTEIMSWGQIQKAWQQGPTKGQSPAHKNFPDQMSMKTVINRALKIDVNSSDDGALLEDEAQNYDVKAAFIKQNVSDNANKIPLGIEEKVDEITVNVVSEKEEEKNNEAHKNAPEF
jgi:recombination protein RecT